MFKKHRLFSPTSFLFLILLLFVSLPSRSLAAFEKITTTTAAGVEISIDPRVELIGIVFRLADNPEYNRGMILSYNLAIAQKFGSFKDHPIVQLARRLRAKTGVSFDAPMSLAVRLPDLSGWRDGVPLTASTDGLDSRWKPDDLKEFLALLPGFAKETHFDEFLKSNEKLYRQTIDSAVAMMRDAHLDWFERFHGRAGARFHLALAMINGPGNYGVKTGPHGHEEMYCILGVWETSFLGAPRFSGAVLSTVAHEFNHSFCNPLIDAHEAELRAAGERIFPTVKAQMQRSAYGNWKTMMYESLVRAAAVRYVAATQNEAAVKKEIAYNARIGFTWVGGLAERLKDYEAHRDRYPTLESFFPEIVKFFNETAQKTAAATPAPKVVRTIPANGDRNVDSALAQNIRFPKGAN